MTPIALPNFHRRRYTILLPSLVLVYCLLHAEPVAVTSLMPCTPARHPSSTARHELGTLPGWPVYLLTRRNVERSHNWLRRHEILSTAEVV